MVQTEVTIGRLGINDMPLEGKSESFNVPLNYNNQEVINDIKFDIPNRVNQYLGTPGLDYDLY